MPNSAICGRSRTSISMPVEVATSRAFSAIIVGVMKFGGSFAMLLHKFTASAIMRPRFTPDSIFAIFESSVAIRVISPTCGLL